MPWNDRVRNRLRLRDLHVLQVVAAHGSMAKAAAQLSVSQPAVSKAIADMENTLGVRLLDRSSQGVSPTLYGRALLKWAVTLFDDLQQGIKEIDFLADPTRGELRLGWTEPMSAGFGAAIIDRLTRKYPRLVIRVTQADPATLEERELRARSVDLMLGRFSTRVPAEDIATEFLFDEIPYVVAGTGNKWLNRRKIELAELFGENWVLPPGDSITGSLIEAAFRAAGVGLPHATVVTFSLQFAISLLTTGRFLGIVPGSMLRFAGRRLGIKVLPLALPIRPGPVGITTLKNRTLAPVAELFIDHARQLAASMGPAK